MEQMLFLVPVVGLLGLLFAVILRQQVVKEDPGTDKMREIADAIAEGANAFLASEYRILVVFVAVLFFVIGFGTRNWITAGCFLVGSGFSTMAGYLGMNAAIRADGAPAYSMCATVLGAVINLVLDPIAIFVLHKGVGGAAAATVIGQAASCLMTALYFRRPRSFTFSRESFRLRAGVTRRIGQLGISSFITQVAIVVIISVANHMIVRYGPQSVYGADIPLSAVGIVMKVFGIVIAFSVGIAVGGQPIAGFNYGAGHFDRLFSTYRHVLLANVAVGAVATLLFQCCPQAIVRLFGNESDLYNQYAHLCFRIYLGGILLCCIQKASSIFLQSIGKPVKSTALSLARDVVFLVPGVVVLAHFYGVTGMLWAAPIADVLALALTAVLVGGECRAMRRQMAPPPILVSAEAAE